MSSTRSLGSSRLSKAAIPRDAGATYFGTSLPADRGPVFESPVTTRVRLRGDIPFIFVLLEREWRISESRSSDHRAQSPALSSLAGAVLPGHEGQYYQRVLPAAQAPSGE